MNHCKTCKHWQTSLPTYGQGEPGRIEARYGGGFCFSEKLTEDYGDHDSDALVYSYQEGGYFWTGPDFGCVHHKAIDEPASPA